MNTDKLNAIRDAHSVLHDAYKAASDRARNAASDVQRLRNLAPTGTPAQRVMQVRILAQRLTELTATPDAALQVAGLDTRYIKRLIDAHKRADTLRTSCEALAPALRRSGLLIARINQFALEHV
jgi:hypothetical protein